MAVSMMQHMMKALPQLRFQPTSKRVRVRLSGADIVDTTRAMLIWEPMRIVASYAIPESDISAELVAEPVAPVPEYRSVGFGDDPSKLLDPSIPFAVHTANGEVLSVRTAAGSRPAAAFRPADPDLAGYVVLDFGAFDWWEEDEPIISHPRDPFHRIDVRPSSRRVRLEHNGVVLADSDRGQWLFEGTFPMPRYYLPRDDVRVDLLPGTIETACAYKGLATHYSVIIDGDELTNIAWSYEEPLEDATRVRGMICFYQEKLDVVIDGDPVERVRTPWS
jgi:uncharacterized protein (DUF427 family)